MRRIKYATIGLGVLLLMKFLAIGALKSVVFFKIRDTFNLDLETTIIFGVFVLLLWFLYEKGHLRWS